MRKTIFNVFVPMENQEQFKKTIHSFIGTNLRVDFKYHEPNFVFRWSDAYNGFGLSRDNTGYKKATESEFIELLKEYKANN